MGYGSCSWQRFTGAAGKFTKPEPIAQEIAGNRGAERALRPYAMTVLLMDLAGITRLPKPDFVARVQYRALDSARADRQE